MVVSLVNVAQDDKQSHTMDSDRVQEEIILDIIKQAQFNAAHKGHEKDHQTMAILFIVVLLGSQLGIMAWKKFHIKSFSMVSLLGLWIVPMLIGLSAGNYIFVSTWFLFSLSNISIIRKAYEKPIKNTTPGQVYRWFASVYSISYGVGIIGYVMIFLAIFRIPELVFKITLNTDANIFSFGIIILFYGLYFGTLGRDFVERLSDHMATSLGYYSKSGFPTKHLRESVCAICGLDTDNTRDSTLGIITKLFQILQFQGSKLNSYKIVALECKHKYHESCIRGWLLVGKKDMCPYCKEKTDMRQFNGTNPWETTQHLYLSVIDALRYILVWNPIIFILIHFLFEILGLK